MLALKDIGYDSKGFDFIRPGNMFCAQADITEPVDAYGSTALCIDVFEHIKDVPLIGLMDNMKKCKTQIISIHNGPSTEGGGVELHINKKSFDAWERMLNKHFKIKKKIKIHLVQMLYICERRKGA